MQSLFNLARVLHEHCEVYSLSLNKDIDGTWPTTSPLELDKWLLGPNQEHIYYTTSISWRLVRQLLMSVKPDVVFVNGLFNIEITLPAMYFSKRMGIKLIISPRGMLQAWGLKRGALRKIVFLKLLKFLLKPNENWHATDIQESDDIRKHFGSQQKISIAANIPRTLGTREQIEFKDGHGKINLVFLSLINPNKNLHLILEAILPRLNDFTLQIYGPVIDAEYWTQCQSIIGDSKAIQYQGPVPPWDVPATLRQFHFFILPTQGENFGHAIFDALSSGVPVIVSKKTPWSNLDTSQAGFYLEDITEKSIGVVLDQIACFSQQQYDEYRTKSFQYAADFWGRKNYISEYSFLFTPDA